jgi:hypothetical protein
MMPKTIVFRGIQLSMSLLMLLPALRAYPQINYNFVSGHTERLDGTDYFYNETTNKPPVIVGGFHTIGTYPFDSLPQGHYRETGVVGPSGIQIPVPATLDSSDGLTVRIILSTFSPTSENPESILWLKAGSYQVLTIGHSNQAWSIGRTTNPSPLNSIPQSKNLMWTTPWDPIYDKNGTTVVLYVRITPDGVAYLDRFVPFYDAQHKFHISWEEGIQEGSIAMGMLGVGTRDRNPPTPPTIAFQSLGFGAPAGVLTSSSSNLQDLVKDLSVANIPATTKQMLGDVVSLIPEAADVLTSDISSPCNTGEWLDATVSQNSAYKTPCGLLSQYAPAVGTGKHYGPPTGRTEYVGGLTDAFYPKAVQTISKNLQGRSIHLSWPSPTATSAYNYALFDTTGGSQTDLGKWVEGGMLHERYFDFVPLAGHKYNFILAPFNAMGVGKSTTLQIRTVPTIPLDVRTQAGFYSGTVSWQPPQDSGAAPISDYQFSIDGGAPFIRSSLSSEVFSNLSLNSKHTVTVAAVNLFGAGDPATVSFSTASTPPRGPDVQNTQKIEQKIRFCSDQYQNCPVTGANVLVAYGAHLPNGQDQFVYKILDTFTNVLVPPCQWQLFGTGPEPVDLKVPNACYVVAEPGVDTNGLLAGGLDGASFCSFENLSAYDLQSGFPSSCNLANAAVVAFGEGTNWNYLVMPKGRIDCSVKTFGDPSPGRSKRCYYYYPNDPTKIGFKSCSPEGGYCDGNGVGGNLVVAYGRNYRFTYANVVGGTDCSNSAFGLDPDPGVSKSCFFAPAASVPEPPASGYTLCAAADYNGGPLCLTTQRPNRKAWISGSSTPRSIPGGFIDCNFAYFPGSVPDPSMKTFCFVGVEGQANDSDNDPF